MRNHSFCIFSPLMHALSLRPPTPALLIASDDTVSVSAPSMSGTSRSVKRPAERSVIDGVSDDFSHSRSLIRSPAGFTR